MLNEKSAMLGLTLANSCWFAYFRESRAAKIRLFCVPYAGGGPQIFQSWSESLPAGTDVFCLNLPGRGKRFADPPYSALMPLVEEATEVILPLMDRPFAFFGHSMGALIAFEVLRGIRRQHGISPVHFFASSCFPPHLPDPHPMHHLPDKEFLDELRTLNGVPKEVLENEELMQLVLPTIRADFTAAETYVYTNEAALSCPITSFVGSRDPLITPELAKAWRVHTTGPFSFRMLPGDHFFLVPQQELLLSMLAAELTRRDSQPIV